MIIFLANQFIGGNISSGGDVLSCKILERVKTDTVILVPNSVSSYIKKQFPKTRVIRTDKAIKLRSASTIIGGIETVWRYLCRASYSIAWLINTSSQNDTIYLTGDFICNSLPAWLIKKKYPNIKIYANFFHRNPRPVSRFGNNYIVSFFSRLMQTISLTLIKSIANYMFVLSTDGKNDLIKEGFQRNKIIISGAGVEKHLLLSKQTTKKNQIVFVGRINVTKGAFDLINIFRLLHAQNPEIKLVMVGGSSISDKRKLNSLIRRYSLSEHVSYLGFVSENDKYKIISQSKALVLPSKEEGFGIVVMEALALKTPVVCYDLSALKKVYSHNNNVHFAKHFNENDFANKISQVIEGKYNQKTEKITTWDDVYLLQSKYFINK